MRFLRLILALMLLTGLMACGGGSSSDSTGDPAPDPGTSDTAPTVFVPGTETTVSSESVDSTGRSVTISAAGTPVDGATVNFPSGALDGSSTVTFGYRESTVSRGRGRASVSVPSFTMHVDGGSSNFSQLVEITLPYEGDAPVPFYINSDNELEPVIITSIDENAKTFSFMTSHASEWTWLDLLLGPDADSEFRPGDDGFVMANYGSSINDGGECFGMTAFVQWYYDQKTEAEGDFYGSYDQNVGDGLTGEDVIATRAHTAINQAWVFANYVYPEVDTTELYRFSSIASVIEYLQRPVVLGLLSADGTKGHAVLAFAANEDDGQLFIYDPNYPNESRQITFDTDSNSFDDYGDYSQFFLLGTGTYDLDESFENIFEDAEHDFTSTNNPQITISSHTSGDTVDTRNITLAGVVESSEVLISQIEVYTGGEKFSTTVDESGNFSLGVSLVIGENQLSFITKGEVDGTLTEITPNNLDTDPFVLTLDVDASVMLVTLTWDKNDTDVDLYVIDPQGDYSAYYHKTTADGGELDYDITTGYGPEHWTLTTSDTIRWDEASYQVRLHYYSDHGNGGTNYVLTVKLYEGTDYETEYVQTGYLGTSNSSNSEPTDTGADWVDNYTIVLSQTPYGSGSVLNTVRSAGLPVINAFIPSEAERRALK